MSTMCDFCGHYPCHPACPNAKPDRKLVCEYCNEPIHEGDRYFTSPFDGTILCENCVEDWMKELDFEEYDYLNDNQD